MIATENPAVAPTSLEDIQKRWHEVILRLDTLEAEKTTLERENKDMRQQFDKLLAHRQASHSELVVLLTTLVSKLPINDVGVIVSRLMEHNANVCQYMNALAKGNAGAQMETPTVLKTLDQTKRELLGMIPPLVDQLIALETPIEKDMLKALEKDPQEFFTPQYERAARCFFKGQVPKERILRQFGAEALIFFNDLTTDPRLNPRPRPEEIVLSFKPDFEALFQQYTTVIPDKRTELYALYERVQHSKGSSESARLAKNLFQRLSFVVELLHYYQHQSTENPEVVFAHRLPGLVEQLVVTGPQDRLDEKLIKQAEAMLTLIINPDHRQMLINNIGKAGLVWRSLKFVLKLRTEKVPDMDHVIHDLLRHLIPSSGTSPAPADVSAVLRLIHPTMQKFVVRAMMSTDRLRKDQAQALAKAVASELGLGDIAKVADPSLTPEVERQLAWAKIKDMIARRTDAPTVAAAIRERLHAKYDAEEIRQSWITLTETDPMSFIRVFCNLPYGANGKTDAIARPVMETYVSRLAHEKYAPVYRKVVRSLHNMYMAKHDSPTLLNFTALVRWVSPDVASKLCADIGMAVHA